MKDNAILLSHIQNADLRIRQAQNTGIRILASPHREKGVLSRTTS